MTKKILFLMPLYHEVETANFKDRFILLSKEGFNGLVLSPSEKGFLQLDFGNFLYQSIPFHSNKIIRNFTYIIYIIYFSLKYSFKNKIDYINCYDPLTFGFIGVLLKFLFRAKLIVEVNGCFWDPIFSKNKPIRKIIINVVTSLVFNNSDILKVLNFEYETIMKNRFKSKKICRFHDFVPTHIFKHEENITEKYILTMGYPFHIKGVDILIKAFLKIYNEFPEYKLKIVGYCPGGDSERQKYIDLANGNPNVEILKPVFYNKAVKLIENCSVFVLSSRTEAMGRVLIEAMASGKPVIGSKIGGIKDIIENNQNGFLFESENVEQLAEKMLLLLSNPNMQESMGQRSLELINEKYSSEQYCKYFKAMIS